MVVTILLSVPSISCSAALTAYVLCVLAGILVLLAPALALAVGPGVGVAGLVAGCIVVVVVVGQLHQ
eukprot:1166093-Karenia_brevis.AAC.1